ncbi:Pex19 protein [Glomus cerebriforme]|uniref:Pex19 protein n=1 Tax=Glomus cerebriforme TaxID=658196 RepID=A0A397SS65_9GLOM|nr:Pex19 protein [Glomus cerebriforme]
MFPPSNASSDKNRDQVDPLSQLDEEYAKQLAADMENIFKDIEDENVNDELRIAMQGLMKTFDEVDENILNSIDNTEKSTTEPNGTSFQDKINQTMNKLHNSSEQLDAEIIDGSNDQLMEEMFLKHLESMASFGGMEKMLESMMETLATKDYLYEPMKEFAQKYPKWLEDNKGKVPPEDYTRYEKQSEYLNKIINKYEAPDFDGNDEQQNKAIINLMQELQDFGQPPPEILNELAPGMELNEQGIPSDISACKTM